jgi:uncharacterized protein YecE (DUF72 family)
MGGDRGGLWVGTSGFLYRHWRGRFYPPDLPVKDWFHHYARHFDTVEINKTFYNLPGPESFEAWREVAPGGFRFSLKYSRYATHLKHLKDPRGPLERFLERAERLHAWLGPLLVQLPPRWGADAGRLDAFLGVVPRRHRVAVEVRDPDWLRKEVFAVLRRHRAALVIHDLIDNHPQELTTTWTYLRFHGRRYGGSYSPQALSGQAQRIERWLGEGRDVYAYFNNDRGGHAPRNAADLLRFVEARGG